MYVMQLLCTYDSMTFDENSQNECGVDKTYYKLAT